MIAGPNGSGKSTLTNQLLAHGVDLGRYINADLIDASLAGPPGEERSGRAQLLADDARRECLGQGISFAFETVMSHPSKIEVLREARRRGYAVVIFFVALESPKLNVERVRQRVALGDIPFPRIASWRGTSAASRCCRRRSGNATGPCCLTIHTASARTGGCS
jgi:predicted ABC-type ATPase